MYFKKFIRILARIESKYSFGHKYKALNLLHLLGKGGNKSQKKDIKY